MVDTEDKKELLANAITSYCIIYKKEKNFLEKADELKRKMNKMEYMSVISEMLELLNIAFNKDKSKATMFNKMNDMEKMLLEIKTKLNEEEICLKLKMM